MYTRESPLIWLRSHSSEPLSFAIVCTRSSGRPREHACRDLMDGPRRFLRAGNSRIINNRNSKIIVAPRPRQKRDDYCALFFLSRKSRKLGLSAFAGGTYGGTGGRGPELSVDQNAFSNISIIQGDEGGMTLAKWDPVRAQEGG